VAAQPDISRVAALIGDQTRTTMLEALADVDGLPATELAARAGVAASTASLHLGKLVDAGLVSAEAHGRHRYYRLADPNVARALEALAVIAPARSVRSLRDSAVAGALREARTCYDHLAGRLGVALADALVDGGLLVEEDESYGVTAAGEDRLAALGIAVDELRRRRRALARPCLDWSERRYHVAGAVGAALAKRALDLGWVERLPGSRAVRMTRAGTTGLRTELGVEL
jgi:DNA-binding transcriptional ArsR family regulator